jgi:capping protein alpha
LDTQVQLATTHTVSFDLPPPVVSAAPSTAASKILALIEEEERKYQVSLNETYQEMGEKTFKGLRRALPLTRQKLDWDKVRESYDDGLALLTLVYQVLGYKLGAELAGTNKSAFPSSS